jgi:hypothetical protein
MSLRRRDARGLLNERAPANAERRDERGCSDADGCVGEKLRRLLFVFMARPLTDLTGEITRGTRGLVLEAGES